MAIEQHPIPQDVAGYKFRLVGEMTLMQFMWLAIGIILALLIYSSPIPFFFKYPIATLFACLGAGIAFIPVEGRSLDKWLVAFIKSIYAPTLFTWQKVEEPPLVSATTKNNTPPTSQPTPPAISPAQTTPVNQPTTSAASSPSLSTQDINVPQNTPIGTSKQTLPDKPDETTFTSPDTNTTVPSSPTPNNQNSFGQVNAQVDSRLPIPFTPSFPNTLVGMTLTPDNKILEGVLVEIRLNGITVRATKSNQLGQFLFAKPLDNGTYQISSEKTGYAFQIYSLPLTGQIVKPLRLQAISKT